MTNPFAVSSGSAVKLDVGETVHIKIDEYKMLDDQFNPGQKVAVVAGKNPSGEEVSLWCSKRALLGAIGQAMQAAGHDGVPEQGAILSVTRLEDGEPKQPGHNAPHLFSAEYKRPAAGASAPAPEPAAPAPAAAPAASAEDFFS